MMKMKNQKTKRIGFEGGALDFKGI